MVTIQLCARSGRRKLVVKIREIASSQNQHINFKTVEFNIVKLVENLSYLRVLLVKAVEDETMCFIFRGMSFPTTPTRMSGSFLAQKSS